MVLRPIELMRHLAIMLTAHYAAARTNAASTLLSSLDEHIPELLNNNHQGCAFVNGFQIRRLPFLNGTIAEGHGEGTIKSK